MARRPKSNGNGTSDVNGNLPKLEDLTPEQREVVAKTGQMPNGDFARGNKLSAGHQNNRKGRFLTQALISKLQATDAQSNVPKFHRMCEKVVALALEGDMTAVSFIFDRVEGKAVQAVEVKASGAVGVITAQTTLQEAARIYANAIKSSDDEIDEDDVVDIVAEKAET